MGYYRIVTVMSEMFPNPGARTLTSPAGKADGRMFGDKQTESALTASWNRLSRPERLLAADAQSAPQAPLRICIDVPLGTSYREMQVRIFRQAWELAGTQLRAAFALGVTPDTISRVLRRCDRESERPPRLPSQPLADPSPGAMGHVPAQRTAIKMKEPAMTDQDLDRWVEDQMKELEVINDD